jgi:hypothetical protein
MKRKIVLTTTQTRSSTMAPGGLVSMKSISVSAVIILVLVSIAAFAQRPQDIFGNTELGPNGYIDFYGLPTPPSRSAGDTPSAPHTTGLPKKGVSARQ